MYHERWVNIDGIDTSVLIDTVPNDQRPPLFIAGLSSHYHDKFSQRIREHFRLVIFDLYWTDKQFSDEHIQNLTLKTLCDHIESVRVQLGEQLGELFQRIFVAGHSVYGLLALAYAIEHPDSIYGLITIGTPLTFDEEVLEKLQEDYLDSNFGSPKAGGPVQRWDDYYKFKEKFAQQRSEQSKQYFVNWYVSMGPLIWEQQRLWQNSDDEAKQLWDPWEIDVITVQDEITKQQRDLNIVMIFQILKLIPETDWSEKLESLSVSTLWVVGLYDSRVSFFHLEDYEKQRALPNQVQCYYSEGAHWPMFKLDCNTAAFDQKLITWCGQIIQEHATTRSNTAPAGRFMK